MCGKEKIKIILNFLENKYKNAKCTLNFNSTYELLIATRLSAQCTDARVNMVTKKLFSNYSSLNAFAMASIEKIKKIIKPCGLYNKKAEDIINMSKILITKYNSKVPNKIENLLFLPGVGRKSANLILGEIFKKPVIIVDTHLKRIVNRLGLVCEQNPNKIEKKLKKIIPQKESISFCHRVVFFGRDLCTARNPSCFHCDIKLICCNKQ